MMSLEDAIKHCEEVAENQERKSKINNEFYKSKKEKCLECAKDVYRVYDV